MIQENAQQDNSKRLVGEAAAQLVEDGMVLGLGTGSTAAHLLYALAQRIQQCNNRVAAQTKDHLNAKALQVFNQQIRRNPLFRLVFGLQTDLRVCRHDNAAPFFPSIHDYRTRQRIKNRSTSHPKFGHCAEWRSGSASAGGSSAATLHRRCVSANADDVGLSVTSALKDML